MSEIRRWFHLRDVTRDVDEEVRFYFDEAVRELEAQGMSPALAREEAARRFGDEGHYRRELVSIDRGAAARARWSARADAAREIGRYAVRSVKRAPGLATGIVLAFALGIGANATMYATVERLLLRPPPHIEDPDNVKRLLVHRKRMLTERMFTSAMTYADYNDLTQARGFSDVAAVATRELTIGTGAEA